MLKHIVDGIVDEKVNKLSKKKLDKDEIKAQGNIKRDKIISDAQAMKRLMNNPDYQVLKSNLIEDIKGLNLTLLSENCKDSSIPIERLNTIRTRVIARINQIERILSKPRTLIWKMENLTEVRSNIKDNKTHERQALGNKTGG